MSEIICSCCGSIIDDENYYEVEDRVICEDCYNNRTFTCDCCGERYFSDNDYGDSDTLICRTCYENEYHRCERCNRLIHDDDTNWHGDYPYCESCYDDICDDFINEYSYKPDPIFHRCPNEEKIRYYGVELEIDKGGKDDGNAEVLYNIANSDEENLYIKSDSSLSDGMELVSHPCSLQYHKTEFPWADVMKKAVSMYYRSHNTNTCGLHIHIGREALGETVEEQEEVISRIMFFFESHWNEMFNFSRRSEYAVEHWASRYGYKEKPKDILEDAKKNRKGRYACVNITNYDTIEIRLFRGTLKYNTFIAAIEMVDLICENAIRLSDTAIQKQSWNEFVILIPESYQELIRYLKERRLYVNEPVINEEEI